MASGTADLVSRRRDAVVGLVTRELSLDRAPEAIAYAIGHPVEVMKAAVRLDAPSLATLELALYLLK